MTSFVSAWKAGRGRHVKEREMSVLKAFAMMDDVL